MGVYHYIALAMFTTLAIIEYLRRGHSVDHVRYWPVLGVVSALSYFAILTYAPFMWDSWLGQYRLIEAEALPFWAQIVVAFFIYEFGVYVWHRTMHSVDWLWQLTHQMHHSAERVDIWGAFWFHPLDSLGWAFLGSFCLVLVIGVSAEAALIVNVLATFPGMFQHTNIRTPRWVGYIVQRPESHSVHHQRGVHAYNYGDIPLFDIVFGTFRNPAEWQEKAGFHQGSTSQLGKLLTFQKIS